MKQRYMDLVISALSNPLMRVIFADFIEQVPEPFWTAPASSSGKYHPDFTLGEGGLVRHSVAVLFMVAELAQLWHVEGPGMDAVVLAAAVHDTYKGGNTNNWEGTVKTHPELAADKLMSYRHMAEHVLEEKLIISAADAVRDHMSLWGFSPTNLRATNAHASVVITADYTTSRRFFAPAEDLLELLVKFGYDPAASVDRGEGTS